MLFLQPAKHPRHDHLSIIVVGVGMFALGFGLCHLLTKRRSAIMKSTCSASVRPLGKDNDDGEAHKHEGTAIAVSSEETQATDELDTTLLPAWLFDECSTTGEPVKRPDLHACLLEYPSRSLQAISTPQPDDGVPPGPGNKALLVHTNGHGTAVSSPSNINPSPRPERDSLSTRTKQDSNAAAYSINSSLLPSPPSESKNKSTTPGHPRDLRGCAPCSSDLQIAWRPSQHASVAEDVLVVDDTDILSLSSAHQ